MRATALCLLLVCAAAVSGGSNAAGQNSPDPQGPSPSSEQPPTFKINVDFVEVDAFVADASGAFVRDLKGTDFEVFEDGKRQTISTFGLVDLPVTPVPAAASAGNQIAEPDVRTNEGGFNGRIYVLVVDDLHTNFARTGRTRAAARAFVERQLRPNDVMAIVHTAGSSAGNQDFTGNKRLLLDAINRTEGRKLESATVARTNEFFRLQGTRGAADPATDTSEDQRVANARQSLGTLRDVAQWFARINGRRKAILFLSEGIDYDITNWAANPSSAVITDSIREAIAAAGKGNVAIYGIDPRGLTTFADDTITVQGFPGDASLGIGPASLQNETMLAQSSLRELSGQMGGFAVVNQNEVATAFDRIVRDNSSYYVLAYYPPPGKVGAFHKIEVRVSRPGVTVRARQGYVTAKPAAGALNERSAGPIDPRKLMTPGLRDALDSPLPLGGLVMHTFAASFKGGAPNASVLVGVEIRGRDLRLDGRDKLTLAIAAVDMEGKIRGGTVQAVPLNPAADLRDRISQTGLRLLNRIDLPPGRYRLRIAAEDASGGNTGSLQDDLEVPEFTKEPLTISAVVLTSAAASSQPTVRPDEELKQVLPAPPVAARAFPQNDQVAVFVEVYDNNAASPHKVDITSAITAEDGRVVSKMEEMRDSAEIQGRRGGYGYSTRLSMKDLQPGAYLLTVSARSRLGNDLPVQRHVPFTVTAARPVSDR